MVDLLAWVVCLVAWLGFSVWLAGYLMDRMGRGLFRWGEWSGGGFGLGLDWWWWWWWFSTVYGYNMVCKSCCVKYSVINGDYW